MSDCMEGDLISERVVLRRAHLAQVQMGLAHRTLHFSHLYHDLRSLPLHAALQQAVRLRHGTVGARHHGPSLFRLVDEYKRSNRIVTTQLWNGMFDSSWMPWPVRPLLKYVDRHHRNQESDKWSMCEYWSNFEIADMDFFRGSAYRKFFEYLDRKGGFYFERWGDAAVHSLAVSLLLKEEEVHHFEDIGYTHEPFWVQLRNALGAQLPTKDLGAKVWAPERADGIGCRCQRTDEQTANVPNVCFKKLGRAIKSEW